MAQSRPRNTDQAEWYFFNGGPGAPRYGDDPTKHAVDHDSEAFVREVLQNANDQGLDNDDPVEVTFRFISLSGEEKRSFLDALGWEDGLAERVRSIARTTHGRGYEPFVDRVQNSDKDIRLLIVEDRNTTGITGGWDQDSNYAALVRDELYSSKQDETAGGSYGLGKSVLWTFSGASTVIFNSHPVTGRDSNRPPRLIARSKFPTHRLPDDEKTYQGAGWLCVPTQTEDGVRPGSLWGDHASERAERLHVDRPSVSGTSAMVVEFRDPTRDERPDVAELADEFVEAAVKFFWPAIYRGDLEVTVETPDSTIEAVVDAVPSIRPFVDCYEARFSESESLHNPGDVAGLDIPTRLPPRADGTETPDGSVRLAARLASPADDDTYLNQIAMFRSTGMVVKYYDQRRIAFGDRNFHGVLAAGGARLDEQSTESDREIDRFLRFAEPPEHDEWESTENLREQYQWGFRTALDDMFDTGRDGLRHLLSKSESGNTLSDNVLDRFPIHGGGSPRSTAPPQDPAFEIDGSSRFDGDRWVFSGSITTTVEDYDGWSIEISLTGIGEDGSRYDEIPVASVSTDRDDVVTSFESDVARVSVDETVEELEFSGHSEPADTTALLSGDVGETELEIRAEIETREED